MIISLRNLSRLFHCSVVNVLCPFQRQLVKYISFRAVCQGLFSIYFEIPVSLSGDLLILQRYFSFVKDFFIFFFPCMNHL